MRTFDKVVEVGSPKTGTTSLGRAFEILGLRHIGWAPDLHQELLRAIGIERPLDVMRFSVQQLDEVMTRRWREGAFDRIMDTMQRYDAFEDGPWHFPGFFKIVDLTFPNSKFILLERDRDQWLASHKNHFGTGPDHSTSEVGDGQVSLVERESIRRYAAVREYFADRPQDLLTMNVCAGDGWAPLCRFLDLPDPGVPFPHLNRSPWQKRLAAKIRAGQRGAERS